MRSYFCGFNGFRQFGAAHAVKTILPTEFSIPLDNSNVVCSLSWAFNAFAVGNEVVVTGFTEDAPNKLLKKETDSPIKNVITNDNFCIILLENGDVFRLNVRKDSLDKLNFLHVESRKRTIFGEYRSEPSDQIEHIACGVTLCIAITKNNSVYNIPSKIYEFPKHEKIKSLVCGFEHALALNKNGDIYSWGNGLRGQLGITDMKVQEVPKIIEALSGVKIINISAGGWHSAAISAFGDIYTWGSNVDGQLGIKVYANVSMENEKNFSRKNPTVYGLPQLIDDWSCCYADNEETSCIPVKVECGARHSIVQNACGKIFCTGWNEYGQLGLDEKVTYKDVFTEVQSASLRPSKIICGPWCTVMII